MTKIIYDLRSAAENHIESLDAYDSDLVPVNRTRGTVQDLRAALAAAAEHMRGADAETCRGDNEQAIAAINDALAATPAQPAGDVSAPTERAAFEAWWADNMNIEDMDLCRHAYGDGYLCHETNRGWMTWQAARAAAPVSGQGASLPPLPEPAGYMDIETKGGVIRVEGHTGGDMEVYGQLCIDSRPRSEDSRAADATKLVCLEAAEKLRTYVGIYAGDKQARRLVDELSNIARALASTATPTPSPAVRTLTDADTKGGAA